MENEFAYKAKDFIFKFRKPIAMVQALEDPSEPQYDENGRASVEYTGIFDFFLKMRSIFDKNITRYNSNSYSKIQSL